MPTTTPVHSSVSRHNIFEVTARREAPALRKSHVWSPNDTVISGKGFEAFEVLKARQQFGTCRDKKVSKGSQTLGPILVRI